MFPTKNFLIFLALFHYSLCDDLSLDESSVDCEDHVITIDANGTTDYHSVITTSVKFYLLTPSNDTIELNSTNTNLVNTSIPTKVLIHGLGTYDEATWVDQMAHVYHTNGNYNVIAVDWSSISVQERFFVVSALDSVGNVIGDFIVDITEQNEEYLSDIHLIGSSMGAQLSGAAGERVANNGTKVGRITGLDPTVPEDLQILDETDADFVDVIHTVEVYKDHEIGTVNFYVLGDDPEQLVVFNDTSELLADGFFIMSIEEADRFKGISCHNASSYIQNLCDKANSVVMGEHVPRNVTGSYLVSKSTASELYAQKIYILSFTVLVFWYLL